MVKNMISRLPKSIQKLFTNKFILYGLLIMSIINIVGYIQLNQWNALGLYISTMVLMSYFSKNMTINILAALTMGNCLACATILNNYTGFEGFKEGNTTKQDARYAKNEASGECEEVNEPKKADGGCKGMGCTKNCKVCYSAESCS